MFPLLWLTAQTVHGSRKICVSGGYSNGPIPVNSTECYDGSSWMIIPSLELPKGNGGQIAANLGSISCLIGGYYDSALVFCTNWSTSWVHMPSLPFVLSSSLGGIIYGANWIGVTSGQLTPPTIFNSTIPQTLTIQSLSTLNWSTVGTPNVGSSPGTINLNGTSCLFGGASILSGTVCLDQSSGTVQWVPGPGFKFPRSAAVILPLPGQVCVAGGVNSSTMNTIECIDETASFRGGVNFDLATFTSPIQAYLSVNITVNGLSCIAGGFNGPGKLLPLADVWCANVSATDNTAVQWLKLANLTMARAMHTAWTLDYIPPTVAPTTSPTTSPTISPTISPTHSPTTSPTTPPTTLTPTSPPTLSPTTLSLAPTTSSPTLLSSLGAEKNTLSPGGVAGIVITLLIALLALILLLLWWCKTKRGVAWVSKHKSKMDGEQRPLDVRQVVLDSTLSVCNHILNKDSKLSTQERLLVQVVIAGAEQDNKQLSSSLPSSSSSPSSPSSIMMTSLDQKHEIKEFNIEDFKLVKFLSQGEGGTAELYKHRETGHLVAIKTPFNVQELEAEAKVWVNAGVHPNVARLIGIANLEGSHRGIIMEYYEGGSLASQTHELSPGELVRVAIDVARGLQHLHHRKVIHRDLAPRNILVAWNKRVAITDFGLSRQLDENDNYQMSTDTRLPWRTLAPELIAVEDGKRVFTEKTDIWALGVTLWELATKKSAYSDGLEKDPIKVMKEKIGAGKLRLDMKPLIFKHALIVTAVIGCLQFNPAHRPSAEQLRWLLKDEGSAESEHQDYLANARTDWRRDTTEYA